MAYTNSSLVTYTKLSPNHSGQRTHSIDRITPHCVVGQLSAESICGCFTSTSRQASCNYGIGYDGRISLCVEEKNRSWCSSSNANDQRAITIEVASDSTHPYAFKDAAYAALIKLCVDICKRNGKKKLLWLADKTKTLNYTPAADEMVLTVHRWFANKSCPGDWMYARMGDLASKVTSVLSGEPEKTTTPTTDEAKTIWDTLYAEIKNAYGTAGLMGNLYAESALHANNLQNNGNTKLGMTDAQFTAAYDSGAYAMDTFIHDGYGYGLAQWTYYSRKEALAKFAKEKGASIGDLSMQLAFLLKEIKGYTSVWKTLTTATTVRAASDAVLINFERPADQSEAVQKKRAAYGQSYYEKYAATPSTTKYYRVRKSWKDASSQIGAFTVLQNAKNCVDANPGYAVFDDSGNQVYPTATQTSFTPYLVKVSISDLNYRKGPGTSYASYGFINPGVYTIVDEQDGWGLLKAYSEKRNGWIKLSYTTKL